MSAIEQSKLFFFSEQKAFYLLEYVEIIYRLTTVTDINYLILKNNNNVTATTVHFAVQST
jgi:hypothetical protein